MLLHLRTGVPNGAECSGNPVGGLDVRVHGFGVIGECGFFKKFEDKMAEVLGLRFKVLGLGALGEKKMRCNCSIWGKRGTWKGCGLGVPCFYVLDLARPDLAFAICYLKDPCLVGCEECASVPLRLYNGL